MRTKPLPSSPLAPWQLDLWLAERLLSPRTALTIATRFRLPLGTAAQEARAAAQRMLRAHPVLASAVDECSGIPELVRGSPAPVRVKRARDSGEIDERLREDERRPVALDGPLARCTVFEGADDGAVVVSLVAHHLIFDGVSQSVVFRDFAEALHGKALHAEGGYFDYARELASSRPLSAGAASRAAELERRLARPRLPAAATEPGPLRHVTLALRGSVYRSWRRLVERSAVRPSVHALAITLDALSAALDRPSVVGITTDARPPDRLLTVGDFANVFPMFFEDADMCDAGALRRALARELALARAMRAEPIMGDLSSAARAAALSVPVVTFRRFAPRAIDGIRVEPFIENADAKRPLAFQIIDLGDELAFRIEAGTASFGESAFGRLADAFSAALERAGISMKRKTP